jgi:malate dehydrogenase (oxaloacetate-decarboxylating)
MTPERPDTNALLARAKKPSEDALRLHPFSRGQLNNSLVFPGLFRGALEVRAVARELAAFAEARGIRDDDILPRMDEWDVHLRVAVAVAAATEAQAQGVARVAKSCAEIHDAASRSMRDARETTRLLMRAGLIPEPQEGA